MSLTTLLFLIFFVGMIAMHLRGHGGHGAGHGGCGGHGHGHGPEHSKTDAPPREHAHP